MGKIVLITGATAGFGRANALRFAAEGHKVIITGRRKERLDELQKIIKEEHQQEVLTLNFDVRDQKAVESHLQSLPKEWQAIDILVNNAGLASGLKKFP